MRYVNNFIKSFLMTSFGLLLGSCANGDDVIELNQEQNTIHTVKMQFIGNVVGFDQQANSTQTRATTSWADGDKIYITFYNDNTIVPGEATYYSSSGWVVNYDGNLVTGTDLKCEVRYFVNATFANSSLVSLNANSEIYEDVDATYTYGGSSLTVQGTLSPKTGRIRFTGTFGATIYTTGISVYTTFSPATNTFSSSNTMLTSTVASNGSTPYIYGTFSDADRSIGLVGSDFAYTRTCTADMLKIGESGYMAIPSESSHNNWRSGLYVKASGVEFKMIPVAGYSEGFFMIGETEVTNQLYDAVTSNSSTSNADYPAAAHYYTEFSSFITKLSYQTNLTFGIPSLEQWKYAAKGGNLSQGYTYAGSNNPGDVAWYSGNASYSVHKVKQLAPNELGIYDMSGNVAEWTSSLYSSSYHFSYFILGGSCTGRESDITSTSFTYSNVDHDYGDPGIGLRLILICP